MKKVVQSCLVCQQAKPDRAKKPDLLQPLPVPDAAWKIISFDFIEGLPQSGKFNCILVVRYSTFLSLKRQWVVQSMFLHPCHWSFQNGKYLNKYCSVAWGTVGLVQCFKCW
jgi:hypothetical protein